MLPLFYLISHYSNLPIRAWEQRKVSDYAINTYGGGTPKTNVPEYWSGEIPWIQSSDLLISNLFNVIPKKYITELAVKSSATKFIPANSIAIVSRVGVGKLVFMPFEYTTSQDFLSLSNLQVDSNFGVYSIYMMLQKELKNIQGTSIKGITKTDLLEKHINKPSSREEQKKIGGFFKQLDDTIALHQRKLDALKLMKKGFLQQMFPKSEENVPKLRVSNFAGEWEQRKAGNIFMTISDKNHAHLPVLSASQELGMIRRDNIGINIKYNEKSLKNYKLVKPGQFVIHLRSFQGGFAWSYITGITSPAYTILDYKEPQKNVSKFWKEVLTSPIFIKRLETITYGIRDGRSISFADFSTLKFSAPSVDEQRKISAFFQQLDNNTTIQQNKLEKLISLKEAYLQNMFI
ncbi:restriction endonuclease subunit S [Listeria innocua]|uniref:restriction endonuclease subunit S n=1 Tax=Listeria innocua TaxID=1642 RepID=UPI0016250F62|nr:restriction endonuclease subunit S [Listeria innocua]MBC2153268.1 restriction endonuclease subunit S [Listeria innocua]